jgi:hypothetical protein
MRISYRITREDFIEAQKLHLSKGASALTRAGRLIIRVLVVSIFVVLLALAFVIKDAKLWSSLEPLLFIDVFWAVVIWVWMPFNLRRTYARDRRLQDEITADITEDGIHFNTAMSDSNLKWGLFVRVLESDRIFVLYRSRQLSNAFPKRAFGPGEADQFRELLRQKLPPK